MSEELVGLTLLGQPYLVARAAYKHMVQYRLPQHTSKSKLGLELGKKAVFRGWFGSNMSLMWSPRPWSLKSLSPKTICPSTWSHMYWSRKLLIPNTWSCNIQSPNPVPQYFIYPMVPEPLIPDPIIPYSSINYPPTIIPQAMFPQVLIPSPWSTSTLPLATWPDPSSSDAQPLIHQILIP